MPAVVSESLRARIDDEDLVLGGAPAVREDAVDERRRIGGATRRRDVEEAEPRDELLELHERDEAALEDDLVPARRLRIGHLRGNAAACRRRRGQAVGRIVRSEFTGNANGMPSTNA